MRPTPEPAPTVQIVCAHGHASSLPSADIRITHCDSLVIGASFMCHHCDGPSEVTLPVETITALAAFGVTVADETLSGAHAMLTASDDRRVLSMRLLADNVTDRLLTQRSMNPPEGSATIT